jgi:tetratricopeptide (TPR) repeat protein
MSLVDAATRQRKGAGGWRRVGRAGTLPLGPLLAACAWAVTLLASAGASAHARNGDDWTGKRVVQKARNFTLRINDEPVERTGKRLDFYKVEQTDGPSLWLKAEAQGSSGWAAALEVIPVEKAIDFFTGQIRARPQDAFPFAMRAMLRQDKKEIDLALLDYNQAIKLDPHDPSLYCSRGSAWHSRHEYGKAIADFDAAVRLDSKNTLAYIGRGISLAASKEYNRAIADFSEAIWFDPLSLAAYGNRGLAWHSRKEYEKAIVDYNLAIRIDPQNAFAFCQRASAWAARKQYGKAVADFNEAIRLDPQYADPYSASAWLLATCPDAKVRDAEKAVQSAMKACELTGWKEASRLDILAAACAGAGDFESAVKWQTRANALAPGSEDGRQGDARIQLYLQKKPVTETSP